METANESIPILSLERAENSPLDPPPMYAQWRHDASITRVRLAEGGMTAWLVTRWEDARAVLSSTAASSETARPGYPSRTPPGHASGVLQLP
jgi:hypothetical protein